MTINSQCAALASLRLYEQEASVEAVAQKYALDPAGIVDFSLNVNPLGSPAGALSAAAVALTAANLYPDVRFAPLRAALAARHGVGEDSLFFGAGLDDVIKLLIHALTSAGDSVLVHLPTFPRYELEARLSGCSVVAVENDPPERIDADRISQALQRQAVAMAFLCTPNNPTGARIGVAEIEGLLRRFPDTLFIVDEALIYPLEEGAIPLCAGHANIIVLRTLSKYFGLAGFRVGYAVGSPALLKLVEVGRPPFNMAAPSVAAAIAALDDGAFLSRCKAEFAAEVAHFRAAAEAIPGLAVRGNHANMLLLGTGRLSAGACCAQLAARGILVADATSFRGLEGLNLIRVSLRGRADNERLITALAEVM